ncbi:hypothetical protein BDV95DRAFT_606570 [Massariosphaeria phaeospora]|uniref:Uncharacterized protein n=1 Tax=Massariosphaeria phaeospora TaxID=100035 RepID=A0A7C8MPK1_9PLEO|nr:hypothetical protein BDV95DRAFT_606570 [Massariosphaeria phaeospora]
MARERDERDSRYYYGDNSSDDRDRERRSHHRRRHRHREDDGDDYSAARRERRERRRAEEARREAELDIDDLRARRASYYSRPDTERQRDSQRMAQELSSERERVDPRRSRTEVRRDGTRRKRRSHRVHDDRSDDYVYGRPRSRGVIEEVTTPPHPHFRLKDNFIAKNGGFKAQQKHVGKRTRPGTLGDETLLTTNKYPQTSYRDCDCHARPQSTPGFNKRI